VQPPDEPGQLAGLPLFLTIGAVGWLCLNDAFISDHQPGMTRLGLVIPVLGWTWLPVGSQFLYSVQDRQDKKYDGR
jgi:hypothetical protein